LAHSPRGWTGARTPSAIKRVRQSERRNAINQPRRSAAKTLVGRALLVATDGAKPEEVQEAVTRAVSALDHAAKSGAIHRNAAARRKSRLMLKINAVLGGEALIAVGKPSRTTGKAAAAKQAKARIAAAKATKAKGAQTAAGKARVALARTTRESAPATPATGEEPEAAAPAKAATKTKTGARAKSGAATTKSGAATTKSGAATTKSGAARSSEARTKAPAKPRSSRTTATKSEAEKPKARSSRATKKS
jgi:small subunit ribosomal protein S20